MNIELHIEKLILDGFAPADRHRITEALERELIRLFAEQRVPTTLLQGGVIPNLDGGAFDVAPNSTPEATGVQVAQAIYGGFNRSVLKHRRT